MVVYELWDTDSFNLVDGFETEAEALEVARELIELNRSAYPEALALARGDERETVWLASGEDLLKRVKRARPPSSTQAVAARQRRKSRSTGAADPPTVAHESVLRARPTQPDRIVASGTAHAVPARRERTDPTPAKPGGSRYIRRDTSGRFTSEQVDVGRSLAADRHQGAKSGAAKPKGMSGQGDGKPTRGKSLNKGPKKGK